MQVFTQAGDGQSEKQTRQLNVNYYDPNPEVEHIEMKAVGLHVHPGHPPVEIHLVPVKDLYN